MAFIGIDFGTSKACVAVYDGERVDVIANEHDNRITPCYVGFGDDEIHIGETAKDKATVNMKNTVYQIKRLMGCKDDQKNFTQIKTSSGFDITPGDIPLTKVKFHSHEKQFRAEEISAMIIAKMKEIAENHIGTSVSRAVISVPACFNNAQRTAVMNAGSIAGFSKVSLINEPTAAAIAFNLNNKVISRQLILIFDFGAGSLDVSVCEQNRTCLTVISSSGTSYLGGIDFDILLTDYFINELKHLKGRRFCDDKKARIRLQCECEKAKRMLSTANQASIQVDCLYDDKDFKSSITRKQFEDRSQPLFDIITRTVYSAVHDAGVTSQMIEQVVLVGGSTRIPGVRKTLINIFDESKLNKTVNADEAVAIGAAVFAEQSARTGQVQIACDIISRSISLEYNYEKHSIIPKKHRIPCRSDNIAWMLKYGGRFKVYEEINDLTNLIQEYSLTHDYISEINLCVDENGIMKIQTDYRSVTPTSYFTTTMLTSHQIKDMIKKAEVLKMENNKWIQRNRAKNDLEKLTYTLKQKYKGIQTADGIDWVSKCDETLKWIESTRNKTAKEFQDRIEEMSKLLRKSVKKTAPVQQKVPIDLDKEERRNAARHIYLNLIRQTREEALKYGNTEFINECLKSERWLEENMKESRDVYLSKHNEFKNKWEQICRTPVVAETRMLTYGSHSSGHQMHSTYPAQTLMLTHNASSSGHQTPSTELVQKSNPLTQQQKDLRLLNEYAHNVSKSSIVHILRANEKKELKDIFEKYSQCIHSTFNSSGKFLEYMQQEIDSLFWLHGKCISRYDETWRDWL